MISNSDLAEAITSISFSTDKPKIKGYICRKCEDKVTVEVDVTGRKMMNYHLRKLCCKCRKTMVDRYILHNY